MQGVYIHDNDLAMPHGLTGMWVDNGDPRSYWRPANIRFENNTYRLSGYPGRFLGPVLGSPQNDVIAYCQVGMRASVDLFALHLIGYDRLRNYYGAWEEWGNRDDLPIATKAIKN